MFWQHFAVNPETKDVVRRFAVDSIQLKQQPQVESLDRHRELMDQLLAKVEEEKRVVQEFWHSQAIQAGGLRQDPIQMETREAPGTST